MVSLSNHHAVSPFVRLRVTPLFAYYPSRDSHLFLCTTSLPAWWFLPAVCLHRSFGFCWYCKAGSEKYGWREEPRGV